MFAKPRVVGACGRRVEVQPDRAGVVARAVHLDQQEQR
jgi:hypothetical protein